MDLGTYVVELVEMKYYDKFIKYQEDQIMPRQARLDAPGTLHHVNYSWDREAKNRR